MNEKIKDFIEKIQNATSIAIVGHKNPDGDSVGSALALKELININFNKNATVIYDGNIPKPLELIPLRDDMCFYEHIDPSIKFDLVILVDYGTKNNLGGAESFVSKSDFIIEFDHHINDEVIGNLCFDDTTKAATSQIILDVIRNSDLEMNQNVIDLLTLAIITDTGNFKFVRNSDVFIDSAYLVDHGADMGHIMNLLNNRDRKTVLVEVAAVANAEFYLHNKLAVAVLKHEDYKKLDGRGELALGLLAQMRGVEFVVLFKEHREDEIGVSMRSKTIPVNAIAESFGGGGHLFASGAIIHDSLENAHDMVIKAFMNMGLKL